MPISPLTLTHPPTRILLIGAHCDDIEIGCGGLLVQLAARFPQAAFHWVTLSSDQERGAETRAAARRLLAGVEKVTVEVAAHQQSYFPYRAAQIKDDFERVKRLASPDLILTHHHADRHQDHRLVNELTWSTFRHHLIVEYEIPKYDGDLGQPNLYVPLSRAEVDAKCDVLMECFPSQRARSWFTRDTFAALARLRGVECNASEGLAEAFYLRKASLRI